MGQKQVRLGIQLFLIITGFVFIAWWIGNDPTKNIEARLPGADNRGSDASLELEEINIGEYFESSSIIYENTEELSESWLSFRGSNKDNISTTRYQLKDHFSSEDPEILWSMKLGEGHSGAAIYKGLVYLLDYDEEIRADVLRCHSLITGEEIWRRWYEVSIKRNHGMSRTIPAVTDDYIVTIGPRCQVMCVDRADGNFRWGIDIEKEYNSEVPLWYTGQCPLIDDGNAIIATGGDALMISVDCKTGEVNWKTPNPLGWKMSHSSVMPFEFGGRKMYVYSSDGGLFAVAANGPDAGEVLWQTDAWNHSVIAPSPVCMPDGKIFLTAGYGVGSMLIQLSENNGDFSIEVLDEYLPRFGLSCEQQTPIYYDGHLFGIQPQGAGSTRNQFVCVTPDDPRNYVWESGSENRFGSGPYILADNKFYVLSDDAVLTIVEPSISEYKQLDQVRIIEDAADSWAPIAVADGYFVLRDSKTMVCINMKL